MEMFADHIMLSRLQFAFTTLFHVTWVLSSIGISILLVVMEGLWLKTKDDAYYHHVRFWGRLFVLNFAVGVVSGLPLEFQFGTNWEKFSSASGGFFGHILGFEAMMSFMLEAGFLYIMLFGWNRVSPRMHLFSTVMVAFGASLSAVWIMDANSWMQTPSGITMKNGEIVLENWTRAILNPDFFWGFSHMWIACLETTAFVVGGISAWYMLKNRHRDFFMKSFKVTIISAIVLAPLQIWLGDGSAREIIAVYQPAKLAAVESHWETNPTGKGASWYLLAWPNEDEQKNDWTFLEIPGGLSLLMTHSLTGEIKGLRDFPRDDQPPVLLPFYSFRVMLAVGFGMLFLMLWTVWAWWRGRLKGDRVATQKWLLAAWVASIPTGFIAVYTGWITREVGRQPWLIYGMVRTHEGASTLPASAVGMSLIVYMFLYTLLFAALLIFGYRIIKKGPNVR